MWVKKLIDGNIIMESRPTGKTWLKTPTATIAEVFLFNDAHKSPSLKGYSKYWHSRSAVIDPSGGKPIDVCERIQGLRDDGKWDTIEWRGSAVGYVRYVAPKAYGKPVIDG